jgi:hypothetical protein
MPLDIRVAQTTLENALRDAILFALGHRLPAVADVASLRDVATQGASSTMRTEDDLISIVVGGLVTAAFRWSAISTAPDDGVNVIQPSDVTANGRWLAWSTPLRLAPTVGGDSFYLHELATGPLQRVIVLDKSMTEDEINRLIFGQVPSVVIEATEDQPDDATYTTGYLWYTDYSFTVSVVAQNLRDRREAAQGSEVTTDIDPGANTLDGLIQALLSGTQLTAVVDGIRNVQIGRGYNWESEMGQRRVVRSRVFVLQTTSEYPAAPNDTGAAQEVDYQAQLTDPNESVLPFDATNYVIEGMTIPAELGLMQPVSAGTAVIASTPVSYTGTVRAFAAYSDIYRDLLPDGSMVFVVVPAEAEQPGVTATALRIGVCRTDGSGVVSDRYLAASREPYGPVYQVPLT